MPDNIKRPGAILRMRLENILEQKKPSILKKWFDLILQTYPADTSKFLKTQKDPFNNPVGGTFSRGLEALFDVLLKGMDEETVASFLDPIIRIRAVQGFSPSQAVSFIFSLKQVLRETVHDEIKDGPSLKEQLQFESKIDELGLLAFNIYVECREKIYQLKANELRKRTFSAFERAGLVSEIPDVESDVT
jgi:hypothetical protein